MSHALHEPGQRKPCFSFPRRISKLLEGYSKTEKACAVVIFVYFVLVVLLGYLGMHHHREMNEELFMRPMMRPGQLIAEDCVAQMTAPGADQKYLSMNATSLKIFYGIWLNGHNVTHEIVEPQLRELVDSGLFSRPNTTLHLVISTNSSTEKEWIQALDVVKKVPNKVFYWNYYNYYEYPGIRLLWEEACKDPNAIYSYFHNKGARFLRGRIGYERSLTSRIIVPWRAILSIFANRPHTDHIGLGGEGWQWVNFFWVRGQVLHSRPKPLKTRNRFYYESWIARRVNATQCAQATGFPAFLNEPYSQDDPPPEDGIPGYSLLYCRETEVRARELWRTIYHDTLIDTFT